MRTDQGSATPHRDSLEVCAAGAKENSRAAHLSNLRRIDAITLIIYEIYKTIVEQYAPEERTTEQLGIIYNSIIATLDSLIEPKLWNGSGIYTPRSDEHRTISAAINLELLREYEETSEVELTEKGRQVAGNYIKAINADYTSEVPQARQHL